MLASVFTALTIARLLIRPLILLVVIVLLPIALRWAASQLFPKKVAADAPGPATSASPSSLADEQPPRADSPAPAMPTNPASPPAPPTYLEPASPLASGTPRRQTTLPASSLHAVPASLSALSMPQASATSLDPTTTPAPPVVVSPDIPWTIRHVSMSIGFLAAIIALVFLSIAAIGAVWNPGDTAKLSLVLLASVTLQGAMLSCVWYFAIHRSGGRWRQLGFRRIRPLQAVLVGILGVVAAILTVGFYAVIVTSLDIDILLPNEFPAELADDPLTLIVLAVSALAIAPVTEELFFRGFAYQALRKRLSPMGAAVLSSGLFGLAHLGLGLIIPFALVGMILVGVFRRTGNLWSSIIIHAGFNAVSISRLAASAWAD